MIFSPYSLSMDHHSSRGIIAHSLLLLLLITSMLFSTCDCGQSDIDCLRSIKESLQDPLNKLSAWQFNNPGQSDDFYCSFTGIECSRDDQNRVSNIRLSGMGLKGRFPLGIANRSSLTGLDLSHNKFSGEIPTNIANLTYLNALRLNDNRLKGHIPAELVYLQRLTTFTVPNNLLSGPLPEFPDSKFPPESYANNKGLCGVPLHPCEEKSDHKTQFIGGFFVGWALFCALFFAIGLFRPVEKIVFNFMRRPVIATPWIELLPSHERISATMSTLEKFATRMSFLELSRATNNFCENNVIATGETGTTYKATLSNGWCLVIKKLCTNSPHIEHEFVREIKTLGRLRHSNLVPLIGFCHQFDDKFLIYKFMPKGSLHDCLFLFPEVIEWPSRVMIAAGVAKGIAWLHQNKVVHRGISSECILLEENFAPKISGFGKAMTVVANRKLSVVGSSYMEDVHAFGMVLFELLTGTRYSEIVSSFDMDCDMFEQICLLLDEPWRLGVCVQSVIEQGFEDEMSRYLRIAGKCVECDPTSCPSMEEVYQMLISTRHDIMEGLSRMVPCDEIVLAT